EYINQAHNELLARYSAILKRKREVEKSITAKQQQLHENQQQLAEQFQQLNALQQQRTAVLQRLAQEIGGAQQRMSKLQDEQQAKQALLDGMARLQKQRQARKQQTAKKRELAWQHENQSIDAQRDDRTQSPVASAPLTGGFATAKGQLPWPVRGKREHSFGKTLSDSAIKAQGVTIAAPSGALVQSIYSGQVIFADWFGGQGLLAIVDHGDGYWSLYGHNQSLLKSVGARVSAGEAIATVGNSGGRDEPALYFEIRARGKPSDPAKWCSRS
ncbi:MAG: peptidoglycan DD-metalloendopeptidase family protein, partial [Gammaproteobacteria bacterium]|nr:peptidoglycan DD-metalloendopeptidase family protein [Gammaproteobacteria bacterium]